MSMVGNCNSGAVLLPPLLCIFYFYASINGFGCGAKIRTWIPSRQQKSANLYITPHYVCCIQTLTIRSFPSCPSLSYISFYVFYIADFLVIITLTNDKTNAIKEPNTTGVQAYIPANSYSNIILLPPLWYLL